VVVCVQSQPRNYNNLLGAGVFLIDVETIKIGYYDQQFL